LIGFWFEIERSGRISMRPDLSFEAGRILCRPQQARSYRISAGCSMPRPYGMSVGPQQAAVLYDASARGVSGARSSCPAKRGTRPFLIACRPRPLFHFMQETLLKTFPTGRSAPHAGCGGSVLQLTRQDLVNKYSHIKTANI
jgi:hypothetical protein